MKCPSCGQCFESVTAEEFEDLLVLYLDSVNGYAEMRAGEWLELLRSQDARLRSPVQVGVFFKRLFDLMRWGGKSCGEGVSRGFCGCGGVGHSWWLSGA